MSWFYARYIDKVAETGKAISFADVYQCRRRSPGLCGGSIQQRRSGTRIDRPVEGWSASPRSSIAGFISSSRDGRPLIICRPIPFIPETNGSAAGAARAFYAIGRHAAIGFSPFAIDDPPSPDSENQELSRAYAVLDELAPLILDR
jgi:hypothetical protein